ncbi:MAG: radical SAM protein [Candidatus Thorarchaeota archaeon]|jgi:radical SAM protein (TIGR04043 family)
MDAEDILRLKVRLLTEGATLPESENSGRKGGAGPVGGRYFVLPNGRHCGIPIRRGEIAKRFGSALLEPTEDPAKWIYDGQIEINAVARPKFLNGVTADGIPYQQIALLHCHSTLATTAYQGCKYWECGTQCKFCTIPTSHLRGDTVLDKSPEQMAEVVQAAEQDGIITDILLTTGTTDTPDMGGERLVAIIKGIRKVSDLPIGVQIEPPMKREIIKEISRAGANAIGMHIESADDAIRKEMCPGKYEYGSLDLYRKSWLYALDYFERGNVSTFILYGLGENVNKTISLVQELAEAGVVPIVAPFRPAPGSMLSDFTPTYVGKLEESLKLYQEVGNALHQWNIDPSETLAGCHRCGGCSPIQEAYDWAASRA